MTSGFLCHSLRDGRALVAAECGLAGLNFANAIVLPLVSVIQAAEDVRLGDLSSRVEIGRKNDEIAQLGKSFNEMLDKINKNRKS